MQTPPFCFLNIYKPEGMTSFDVIYKLRKRFNIKKIGHSGTLDPFADGVLQIALGGASRLLEYLESDKEYIAEIQFGYTSSTLDIEGEITEAAKPDFSYDELKNILEKFKGKIKQTPPKFSAIKRGGKKLCDIARKNPEIEIEIPEREIEIFDIKLLDFTGSKATIKVDCSKGTYIRTLGDDIAKKLNTRGYLTKLTRVRAGSFKIENSVKIDEAEIEKDGIEPQAALPFKKYEVSEKEFSDIKNGKQIFVNLKGENKYIQLIYQNRLVSVGILSDNRICVKKFFNSDGIV